MEAIRIYNEWLNDPFIDMEDKAYLQSIKEDKALIEELFYRNLSFGTAGMRGKIGMGTNRINKYSVAKATQSYANYIIKSKILNPSVVIAYDTRHGSKEFAEMASRVLLENEIKVYLFDDFRSVPELSYAVRLLNTSGGIVITASHNPKEYNGYKLYSDYGGQLIPEDMEPITAEFEKINGFDMIKIYNGQLKDHSLFQSVGKEIDEKYFQEILNLRINNEIDKSIKVVYSPIHGTGITCINEILSKCGYNNVYLVKEQNYPDSEFSTVNVPNPENKEALNMAVHLAQEVDADLVLATDPDCDRVGIAIKNNGGEYILLNGNQIGAMMIDYIIHASKTIPNDAVMIQTIVTSNLGKKIAENAGVEVIEVLTGFKYIGELITEFERKKNKTYLLGYEESYGFLSGVHARDKDAANACLILVEMVAYYKKKGKTIYSRLNEIYEQYGYYYEDLHNISFDGIDGMKKMDEILETLRNNPIGKLDDEKVKITDYLLDLTGLPKENVLKLNLEGGSWVAFRPSGTEPKFKIYFSSVDQSIDRSKEKCERMKNQILEIINEMIKE